MERFRIKCPRCFKSKFWKTSDNRLRCKNCHYIFRPKTNLVNISNKLLKQVIVEFVLGHSTNVILERVKISKHKLLKTLTILRIAITKDLPEVFEGIIEVDETYLGGQMKNKTACCQLVDSHHCVSNRYQSSSATCNQLKIDWNCWSKKFGGGQNPDPNGYCQSGN